MDIEDTEPVDDIMTILVKVYIYIQTVPVEIRVQLNDFKILFQLILLWGIQ